MRLGVCEYELVSQHVGKLHVVCYRCSYHMKLSSTGTRRQMTPVDSTARRLRAHGAQGTVLQIMDRIMRCKREIAGSCCLCRWRWRCSAARHTLQFHTPVRVPVQYIPRPRAGHRHPGCHSASEPIPRAVRADFVQRAPRSSCERALTLNRSVHVCGCSSFVLPLCGYSCTRDN